MTDCGICVKVWLQEFAWTEEDKEEDMKSRSASTGKLSAKDASSLQKQPMFCMETAVNMFYWSVLVYDHEEVMYQHRLIIMPHALIAEMVKLHDNVALLITANLHEVLQGFPPLRDRVSVLYKVISIAAIF